MVDLEKIIRAGLDIGFRLFDTARYYENEAQLGSCLAKIIAEGSVKREDIYIVSKVCLSMYIKPNDIRVRNLKSI